MIQIIKADGAAELALIDNLRTRAAEIGEEINRTAAQMMADVKERGYEAVREYSVKLDGAEPKEFSKEELQAAYDACDSKLISAMEHAANNIRDYNEHLLCKTVEWTNPDGGKVGRIVRGLTRVGVYVPGGTAAYPSSVLMNCIPAKLAGVKEICMVTPPGKNGKIPPNILAAARICGVDRVFRVGGAQAVAALAYGTESIPKVDKIVGPGNQFVAEAKKQVFGQVGIDMVAGPSEILVIADGKCRPEIVAADLLSQAEHDPNASAVLVTDSAALAEAVQAAVEEQLPKLLRKDIARASIDRNGKIIVAQSLDTAVEIANEIAPEHLELCVEQPFDYLDKIQNAGSVFLGRNCPEALGDYFAGPNHTLPTSGTARFSSPLSVDDFVKKMQYTYYTKRALEKAQMSVSNFAKKEGLTGHARSVDIRFDPAFAEETP